MYTRPASGIEGSLLRADPSPAYGSESSTGGGRLVRALAAMETARHPFPVSSTAPHYRRRKSECQGDWAKICGLIFAMRTGLLEKVSILLER